MRNRGASPGCTRSSLPAETNASTEPCSRTRSLNAVTVLGFTDQTPELMVASDVLVQNAGGLTCLEAFAGRRPSPRSSCRPAAGPRRGQHPTDALRRPGLRRQDADGLCAIVASDDFGKRLHRRRSRGRGRCSTARRRAPQSSDSRPDTSSSRAVSVASRQSSRSLWCSGCGSWVRTHPSATTWAVDDHLSRRCDGTTERARAIFDHDRQFGSCSGGRPGQVASASRPVASPRSASLSGNQRQRINRPPPRPVGRVKRRNHAAAGCPRR